MLHRHAKFITESNGCYIWGATTDLLRHLDRLSPETTMPNGVQYDHLLGIGIGTEAGSRSGEEDTRKTTGRGRSRMCAEAVAGRPGHYPRDGDGDGDGSRQ